MNFMIGLSNTNSKERIVTKYLLMPLTLRQLQRLVGRRAVENPFAVRVLVG